MFCLPITGYAYTRTTTCYVVSCSRPDVEIMYIGVARSGPLHTTDTGEAGVVHTTNVRVRKLRPLPRSATSPMPPPPLPPRQPCTSLSLRDQSAVSRVSCSPPVSASLLCSRKLLAAGNRRETVGGGGVERSGVTVCRRRFAGALPVVFHLPSWRGASGRDVSVTIGAYGVFGHFQSRSAHRRSSLHLCVVVAPPLSV